MNSENHTTNSSQTTWNINLSKNSINRLRTMARGAEAKLKKRQMKADKRVNGEDVSGSDSSKVRL